MERLEPETVREILEMMRFAQTPEDVYHPLSLYGYTPQRVLKALLGKTVTSLPKILIRRRISVDEDTK